jgi:hypothetical protein
MRRVTQLLVELTTRHDTRELPHNAIITSRRYTHDFGGLPVSVASERSAGDRGLVLAAPGVGIGSTCGTGVALGSHSAVTVSHTARRRSTMDR